MGQRPRGWGRSDPAIHPALTEVLKRDIEINETLK
jgi:hypothetical protein